jgi:hypothetical protein
MGDTGLSSTGHLFGESTYTMASSNSNKDEERMLRRQRMIGHYGPKLVELKDDVLCIMSGNDRVFSNVVVIWQR